MRFLTFWFHSFWLFGQTQRTIANFILYWCENQMNRVIFRFTPLIFSWLKRALFTDWLTGRTVSDWGAWTLCVWCMRFISWRYHRSVIVWLTIKLPSIIMFWSEAVSNFHYSWFLSLMIFLHSPIRPFDLLSCQRQRRK